MKGDPRLGRKRKYSNVLKTCTYCGMIFEVDHKHGGKKHCTPECHAKHRSQLLKTAYQNGNKKIGGGISKWFQYKDIRVQGTYELRACKIFDSWLSQGIIRKWEYANERVTYTWEDGTEHTYLIDFTIELNNGDAQYFETKGFIREYDERKWEAAKNLGLNIQVWFKEDLDREERKLNMTP